LRRTRCRWTSSSAARISSHDKGPNILRTGRYRTTRRNPSRGRALRRANHLARPASGIGRWRRRPCAIARSKTVASLLE
jgi:hypothetical protein